MSSLSFFSLFVVVVPQDLFWGIKEIFAELFACLDYELAYNGNPVDELVAVIGKNKYGPDETPTFIKLY